MASGKSLYLSKAILDHVCSATIWTPPATIYFALSTALWVNTATGAAMTEVVGTFGYARVAVTNNAANFPAATGASTPAVKSNGIAVNWPNATGAWGTVRSWYACDAASAGNVLFGADLAATKAPLTGDTISAAIGALVWTEA